MFIIMLFIVLGGAFCSTEENTFGDIELISEAQPQPVRVVVDQADDRQVLLSDVGAEFEEDQTQERLQRGVDVRCCERCYVMSEQQTCKGAVLRGIFLPKTPAQEKFKAAFWITAVSVGTFLIILGLIASGIFGSPQS